MYSLDSDHNKPYSICPRYNRGDSNCCGIKHDASRRKYVESTFDVELIDGSQMTLSVFRKSNPENRGSHFYSDFYFNDDLTRLGPQMTPGCYKRTSTLHQRHHVTTPMCRDCPLR